MSQSYPIWIDVSGDNYKSSKSFGSRDSVTMDIKVGSSKSYSNDLARVSIHMREDANGNREFALAVDGLVLRSGVQTKDKKYYRISRLNPYIGYTKIVKIPVNLIKITEIFEGGHYAGSKKVSY